MGAAGVWSKRALTGPQDISGKDSLATGLSWSNVTVRGACYWGATLGCLLACLLWGYWQTVTDLINVWRHNQDYSAGQLVPFVAVYLVWRKRRAVRAGGLEPCWWGLGVILLAQMVRLSGGLISMGSLVRYSLPLTIMGLVLTVCGRRAFLELRWVLIFLFLMVPFPARIHQAVSGELQHQATASTTFVLDLAGVNIVRHGNVIELVDHHVNIGVVEACSGLRMLTAFIIVAATVVFLIDSPRWQKAVLMASSVVLAIVCNLARLVTTVVLYVVASDQTAERFFHDFAGLAMMPLAVLLLLLEHLALRRVFGPGEKVQGGAAAVADK